MAAKDRNKTIEKIISTLIDLETYFEKIAKPRLQYKNIRWSLACACEELYYRIKKKPKSDGNLHACPACKVLLLKRAKYCEECGQALDWRKEE